MEGGDIVSRSAGSICKAHLRRCRCGWQVGLDVQKLGFRPLTVKLPTALKPQNLLSYSLP